MENGEELMLQSSVSRKVVLLGDHLSRTSWCVENIIASDTLIYFLTVFFSEFYYGYLEMLASGYHTLKVFQLKKFLNILNMSNLIMLSSS